METRERRLPSQVPVWTTIAAASSIIAGIWLSFQVSKYGWQGTFWMLWEGSPYPPDFRDSLEALDAVTALLETEERSVVILEEKLQEAKQQSTNSSLVAHLWNEKLQPLGLEKILANLGYQLDRIASKVDAIQNASRSGNNQSAYKGMIKQGKKELSNRIVGLMERTDLMIDFYKKCQSESSASEETSEQ